MCFGGSRLRGGTCLSVRARSLRWIKLGAGSLVGALPSPPWSVSTEQPVNPLPRACPGVPHTYKPYTRLTGPIPRPSPHSRPHVQLSSDSSTIPSASRLSVGLIPETGQAQVFAGPAPHFIRSSAPRALPREASRTQPVPQPVPPNSLFPNPAPDFLVALHQSELLREPKPRQLSPRPCSRCHF